jgi:hypothetical protein
MHLSRWGRMRPVFLSLLLLAACDPPQAKWVSATIDGRPRSDFTLVTRGEEVVGGHDGCNGWGRSDQPGMITIDLQECPPDPVRDAYWRVATGKGATLSRQGTRLVARNTGHVGVFAKAD